MSVYKSCSVLIFIALALPAMAQPAPVCDSAAACRALAPEAAGPGLLRLLQNENWDTRVEAALALGGIGYKPAVAELVEALSNERDWQLAYAAVVSLVRIKDPSSLQALREAAESYWYPPLRVAAECAVEFIESGQPCGRHAEILDIDSGGLQRIRMNEKECEKRSYRKVNEAADMKQYGDQETMQRFKYTGAECDWFGEADKETGSRTCLARRIFYPQIAARTAEGWLTGRDQGASGGELMFFPDSGKPYEVLRAGVEDIYVLEKAVLALTGYESATAGSGMVYSLRKDAGKWMAEPLLRLPGAPESSYKTIKQELVVKAGGTLLVVGELGKPRIALCGKK